MDKLTGPIVVLGGGGFIGANLTNRLVREGYDVTAVSRHFPDFRIPLLQGATLKSHDLRDREQVDNLINGAGTVFHLAADMGGVAYFNSDADFGASSDNGRITLNVMQACARFDVARLFFASSACTYPIELQCGVPAPLLHEYQLGRGTPDALYGAEKLQGMRLAGKVAHARVGVFHTIYGPYQEYEGIRMKFPPSVAKKAILAKKTGKLELWGDGSQLRSYQFIDDAVEKILRIASANDYHGPVNVGLRGAASCLDIAKLCLKIVGAEDAEIVLNPAQPTGVTSRDCDNRKFNREYGRMKEIGYEEGFARSIEWIESIL